MFKLFIISIFALLPIASYAQEIDYLILNNEYEKALQVIESELAKDEVQPKLYLKKGQILQKRFDYLGAIAALEKAYQLDSLNTSILNELAETHASLGNNKQALPYYKALYSTDTTNSVYTLKLARAWINLKTYREPFIILKSAFQRDSTNLMINKLLAFSASRTGVDSLAILLYNKVNEVNPTDLNNYINLANLYQKKENYLKIVETLEKGLKVFPEETTLLTRPGDAHFGKRAYTKAIQPYEAYLSIGDSTVDVVKNLGISYYYEKCTDESLYLLEKSLMLRPNDPTTALFIGLCYKDLKDIDQSLAYMNFAAKTAVPYYMSDIYNQLGILYGLKREFKKSIEALKEAYSLDSTKVDVLFKIATTYEEFQKDKTNALNYYNSYLKAMKEENDYQKGLKEYALERKRVIKEYQLKYGKQIKK